MFIDKIIFLQKYSKLINLPSGVFYNDFGEFVYEWWGPNKKLIIYHSPGDTFTYIKVWGANIHTDMEDGEITSLIDLKELMYYIGNKINVKK
jgi:hypothetical protein